MIKVPKLINYVQLSNYELQYRYRTNKLYTYNERELGVAIDDDPSVEHV